VTTDNIFKHSALCSYFALIASLLSWILLAPHSDNFPIGSMLLLAMLPLLFPLRGLLHGKTYTHAWTSFLMLFYFSHGVGEAYSATEFYIYPWLEIIFSVSCFSCSIIFIKLNAKMRVKSHN